MTEFRHYVCDRCGLLETREQVPEEGDWTCADCGSQAAWEFMSASAAQFQSRRIIDGIRSGLFRGAA